jgi:hypothetical protein
VSEDAIRKVEGSLRCARGISIPALDSFANGSAMIEPELKERMNVSFTDFGANVPNKDRYERGIDYLWHEFDLEFEDAFNLISQLKNNRSSVTVCTPSAIVDFYIFHGELNAQIDADGFWHASNLDLDTAKEILKVASEGCENFGEYIPGTNLNWDVY